MRQLVISIALALLLPGLAVAGKSIHRADQAPGTAEQVAAGQKAYAVCGGCHGAEGEGVQGLAPTLNSPNWLAAASNEFIATTIRQGRPGSNMVPWDSGLGDDAVDNIVAYIRSWQTEPGLKLDEKPLKGDLQRGKQLFRDVCADCHGIRGAGYAAGLDGLGIGRRAFLEVASDGFLREMVRRGKDKTAMESFTNGSAVVVEDLTDEDIDSVIMHLRAGAW